MSIQVLNLSDKLVRGWEGGFLANTLVSEAATNSSQRDIDILCSKSGKYLWVCLSCRLYRQELVLKVVDYGHFLPERWGG
jgi:hypothetical protein